MRRTDSCRTIVCRNDRRGTMDFYLETESSCFFLFQTRYYSHTVFQEFCDGKSLDAVFEQPHSFKHRNSVNKKRKDDLVGKRLEAQRIKLKERIIRSVKYVEQEYSLEAIQSDNRKTA